MTLANKDSVAALGFLSWITCILQCLGLNN